MGTKKKAAPRWPAEIENSSQIARLHWHNNNLQVQFVNGGACWQYEGVTEPEAISLAESHSPGSAFHQNIKSSYPARRISEDSFGEVADDSPEDEMVVTADDVGEIAAESLLDDEGEGDEIAGD